MRPNKRQAAIAVALIIFLGFSWDYLGCLASVAWTYTYWVLFPKVQFSVPPPAVTSHSIVPNIIHQTWKTKDVPEKWRAAQQSCIDAHPGYEYKLWTDDDAIEFIKEHYPWFLASFLSYPFPIQRADAIRYFVLHHYGGIYIDLDIECKGSLAASMQQYNFTAPMTYPLGISNDVFAAVPGAAFLERVIRQLPRWNRWLGPPYVQIMFSTGPMQLTVQYAFIGSKALDSVAILPPEVYGKYATGPDVIFNHLHGSSWHEDDAAVMMWLDKHWKTMVVVGIVLVASAFAGYVFFSRHHASGGGVVGFIRSSTGIGAGSGGSSSSGLRAGDKHRRISSLDIESGKKLLD